MDAFIRGKRTRSRAVQIGQDRGNELDIKRKSVRPFVVRSVAAKKFKSFAGVEKRDRLPAHPLIVTTDLRNGSLDTLDAYLKKHGGIPDREVAIELRKLLSGNWHRTKFRLVVVDHPSVKPSKGGRPRKASPDATPDDIERVQVYRKHFKEIGKIGLALEEAALELEISESSIRRAIRVVEGHETAKRQILETKKKIGDTRKRSEKELLRRRDIALANLRGSSQGGQKT